MCFFDEIKKVEEIEKEDDFLSSSSFTQEDFDLLHNENFFEEIQKIQPHLKDIDIMKLTP